MKKKCILFDADGVVVNDLMYGVEYQKQSGISSEEMLPFYNGVFQECLVGKADLKKVITPWLEKWKFEGTADEFLNNWFEYEDVKINEVIEFVQDLRKKGIICCLATNQENYRTEFMIEQMGFADLFDHIYSSAQIGHKKPKKEFYEYILREMNQLYGFAKEEIVYVDDTVENVQGGTNAGIDSFHFTNLAGFKEFLLPLVKD